MADALTPPTVDPKRTNVKAREVPDWPDHCDENARYHGEPGDMVRMKNGDGSVHSFAIACPGCGVFGCLGIRSQQANWTVAGGSLDDVTTLTLSPSILKSCCGWHGYLRNGAFESC